MLPASSIRQEFIYKLVPAFGVLVFLFSYFVFTLIENKIYDDIKTDLLQTAEIIVAKEDLYSKVVLREFEISYKESYKIETILDKELQSPQYILKQDPQKSFYSIIFPINTDKGYHLVVRKDVTDMGKLLDSIQKIIIFLNLLAIFVIGGVSYLLSKILARPISKLTHELSLMDEESLKKLNRSEFPDEFKSLALTINSLISKIDGHIKYQKELFIGLAHELKTPLAVIKTKNSVALMKKRDPEKYIEVLKDSNKVIDEMNTMTSSILDIGRAEYEQLAPNKRIDITKILNEKIKDYKPLIESKNRKFVTDIAPYEVKCHGGETLIGHILQNFIQNAVKFTPEGKTITLKTSFQKSEFTLEVIDEGCGLSEAIDPFAPFIRHGDKQGVGLGLFLAKNAANAMNGQVGLINRTDGLGAVAFLKLRC